MSTTSRGYGHQHQLRREALIRAAIGTHCPEPGCGVLMTNPAEMVADHTTPLSMNRNSVADRVHCLTCSNKQGGRLAHSRRNRPPEPHPGRL